MKSEDIKKLCNEEKKDLSRVKFLFAIHVWIFLFQSIQAQTFINGFGRYESFTSTKGFEKIFSFDLNQDSLKDVIVYKPGEKKYAVHRAISTNRFTESSDKNFEYEIDDLNSYSTKTNEIVFASRNSKTIGIASISYFGLMQIVYKKELGSFPSRIYAADMNNDNHKRIIAAGNSCAGIQILNPRNFIKPTTVLYEEKTFESLAIFDFNYDFYNDIVAIDFLENQLVFISNYSNDYYVTERTIAFREKISDLSVTKFDDDPFYDLVFISQSSVEVLLGDSVYSFARKLSFPTNKRVTAYSVADFNADGYNDLAYLYKQDDNVNVVLSSGGKTFHQPIQLAQNKNLEDIILVNGVNSKLVSISSDGMLVGLSRVENNEKEFSFTASKQVGFTGSFSTEDFSYYYFVDEDFQTLKVFQNWGNQSFKYLFNIPLSKNPEIIEPQLISKENIRFFCYSNNSSLLEIIDFDFITDKIIKNRMIAEGPITDYLFERRKKNIVKVFATDQKNLISSVYELSPKKIKYLYEDTLYNVLGGIYSRIDSRKSYVWRLNNSSLSFEMCGLSDGTKSILKILDIKNYSFDLTKMKMLSFMDKYNEVVVSYFGGGDNGRLFYYSSNDLKAAKIKNISQLALYKSINHLNLISKIILDKEKLQLNNRALDLNEISNLILNKKIDSYNLVNINKRKYFSYSSIGENKITFIGVR